MQDDSRHSCLALARHFSALCGTALTLVDLQDRAILFTHCPEAFFCEKCPNRCRLLSTMLYGCNEARRWQGRYTFYCPIGLVFTAVSIPQTERAMVAGPVVMGELQDTLLDLPEHIDREQVKALLCCSSQQLRHMSSVLELAVCGLQHRPDASFDSNTVSPEEADMSERNEAPLSPVFLQLEDELRQAVLRQEKSRARELLNQLLRYVYSPHPDQLELIRSRALQLATMLTKIAAAVESTSGEERIYLREHIPALKSAQTPEQVDEALARMLHLYVDYTFDFNEIKHSDTVYRAMEYIRSNFSRKISLEEIASYVHLSGSHLSGTFHKETGQTISSYMNHIRIEKSKQLLIATQTPIAEVGALCGFEDQSYFSRVFRQCTNLSPKRFREANQNQ